MKESFTLDKVFRVGIAGYGVVGKRRRHFIDQHPNFKTVAVCDEKFSDTGVMSDGVAHCRHYSILVEHDLDVLFVCLPNYLAAEVTIAGLQKCLNVFCEKPPGKTVDDIKRVIEEEKKHPKICLKYGFNHRYHDSVRRALQIINSGELGSILNIRGVYGKSTIIPFGGGWRADRNKAGGGILLDQGIHMVDLMRLFCGEFVEIKSYITNSYWHHDVEDNAYAIMKDAEGRIVMLHSSATQWQHRFLLDVTLTEGYLELRGILSGSKSYGEEKLVIGKRSGATVGSLESKTITYLEDNSWRDEVNEFADAVLHSHVIKNGNSADALATMLLIFKIYCMDKEWKEKYNISDE